MKKKKNIANLFVAELTYIIIKVIKKEIFPLRAVPDEKGGKRQLFPELFPLKVY